MAPFKALYGKECRTPLNWRDVGEKQLFGPQIVQAVEAHVRIIREKIQAAQRRYKQYAHKHQLDFSLEDGYYVYLKVPLLNQFSSFRQKES